MIDDTNKSGRGHHVPSGVLNGHNGGNSAGGGGGGEGYISDVKGDKDQLQARPQGGVGGAGV